MQLQERIIRQILINYRWVPVIFFLLPLSILYDCYYYLRNAVVFYVQSAPKRHSLRVRAVQAQVRGWNQSGRRTRMCTARPGWQTMCFREAAYKKSLCAVHINLVDVLDVDVAARTVRVEPLVTMGQLTATLTPLGWTLPVVPELDDLTVGGMVMGTGIESSSHKHGLFQHQCVSFELVMADGEVVECSADEKPDLFYAVPWSYGTLGFLTAAVLMIIPASRFVKLTYQPCTSEEEIVRIFSEETRKTSDNDFVEGVVFSRDTAVVMTGQMTDTAEPSKINAIGRFWKPWFYKHVEKSLNSRGTLTEFIPLRDYYHRHSRSIFWQMGDIVPFGNHVVFRYLLGWAVPPKVALLKLTQGQTVKKMYEETQMFQDMLIPLEHLQRALNEFHKETLIYPLWLCPFHLANNPGMLKTSHDADEMGVDIGAYGTVKRANYVARDTTRRLEEFVRGCRGFQMLYADSFMTRTEFRQMFDHSLYDRLRLDYKCEDAFPEVYNKVNRSARL